MERGNKDKILRMIDEIEKKNSEIEKYITNLSILTRNESLKEIMNDIIKNNEILQEIEGSKRPHSHTIVNEKTNFLHEKVDNYILKIQENPAKKIIYLREFLENFESISKNDKEVILNSLQDEINMDKLKEKMISLVMIFL
ncbi:MAG: hypothetical protein ACXAB8_03775 [Promethearchaeota archaeon]|jgi:hypothetical protein